MTSPVPAGFGPRTTADEVLAGVDLAGKLAIVTGGAGGIGLGTARALVAAGADVVIGGRTPSKLAEAATRLEATSSGGRVVALPLDLMSIASVDGFAEAILALGQPVDILVNNAAVIGPLIRNDLGIESGLMTNYIGHAILTSRLSGALAAPGARLVCVSSFGHHYSPVVFDDLNFERRDYSAWLSYGQSKTACVLLAVRTASRLGPRGVDAFALHPGAIATDLPRSMVQEDFDLAVERGSVPDADGFKSIEQGSATSVWAATAPELAGRGPLYLEDCAVAPILDAPNYRFGVMPYALDLDAANRLWVAVEGMIGRELPL